MAQRNSNGMLAGILVFMGVSAVVGFFYFSKKYRDALYQFFKNAFQRTPVTPVEPLALTNTIEVNHQAQFLESVTVEDMRDVIPDVPDPILFSFQDTQAQNTPQNTSIIHRHSFL